MSAVVPKPQIVFYIKDVEETVGKPRVTLRRWWRSGKFPIPKMLNGRLSWRATEIYRWIDSSLGVPHG
jgi:prophage regulatory protein